MLKQGGKCAAAAGFLGLLRVVPLVGTERNICMHANVIKKHAGLGRGRHAGIRHLAGLLSALCDI
jgi:hypothetical protein